jgi:hypothetical protein
MRLRSKDLFQTVRTEGGLLPSDLLVRIADGDPQLEGVTATSYHLAPNERLNERITRSWNRLMAAWCAFSSERTALNPSESGARITREHWLHVLLDELGYGRVVQSSPIEIDSKKYPVFSQWQHSPIHLVGCNTSIEHRSKGVKGAAGQSPHSMVQELLNRSPERLWGIVSNGLRLRLLRDNVMLTRQAYVDFDLETMFDNEVYSDFALLWLICHQSRLEGEAPEDCWLERWCLTAAHDGVQALDQLRFGVERAITVLGSGFLANPVNESLQRQLNEGELTGQDYYRQLLRLVYRLLFLFVAEDRNGLLATSDRVVRERYLRHYSTQRLRELAAQRRGTRHGDLYEMLKLVMGCLHRDGCAELGLPALGSYLWSPDAIGSLGDCLLSNEPLLEAIRELAFVEEDGVRRPVDFRNLGAEELGSIYESLLELHPEVDRGAASFNLKRAAGNERKTTGSYYTPAGLISSLLDSALEPVLYEAASANDPEAAILHLRVCDPACGSGHFLIAAAHRIAKRLAVIRTGDSEPSPSELRRALRDVVAHCVYGVDVNPMAVELCKVSLWLEALEAGKPLSFLDHRIVVGNSLLGTTPALIAQGLPNEAFKALLGDDTKAASALRKRNAAELSGQLELEPVDPLRSARGLGAQVSAIDRAPDNTVDEVLTKERFHRELLESPEHRRARLVADLWCGAFVQRKQLGVEGITAGHLRRIAAGDDSALPSPDDEIWRLIERLRFHHWHIAFPDVFDINDPDPANSSGWNGGFDVVLGNPPWERVKLQEKEFFSVTAPDIAEARNKAARSRLIAALEPADPDLYRSFMNAKRDAEGASYLLRSSGRYPLCGRGDVNTYAVFSEGMRTITRSTGHAGLIVPTGIATDDTTKHFFADLMDTGSLVSLYDFENREGIFPGIDSRIKFCLLTMAGTDRSSDSPAEFCFFATRVEHLADEDRRFTLTADDIALLNPNTRTCPIFRTRRDAEITKKIYERVPVLVREGDPDGNPWGVSFKTMFHMSNDSDLFRTRDQMENPAPDDPLIAGEPFVLNGNVFERPAPVDGGSSSSDGTSSVPDSHGAMAATGSREGLERWLPLYEAKMIHIYDPKWATYAPDGVESYKSRLVTSTEKRNPHFQVMPRYWVPELEVNKRLGSWRHQWLLGWRDIGRATDERTIIVSMLPRAGVGNNLPLAFLEVADVQAITPLLAIYSSFAMDYVARSKVGGSHLNFFVMAQLPAPTRDQILGLVPDPNPLRWLRERVDEAASSEARNELARRELDALAFAALGFDRDDICYVMNSFEIVERRDQSLHSSFRTRDLILQAFDEQVGRAARHAEKGAVRPAGKR